MAGIRQYYDEQNSLRREISVPEWGMTFYVGPLTVGQYERIAKTETDSEQNRMIILACAKDESGRPALDAKDQEELARYGTTKIVPRVALAIMEAAKAIEGTEEKKA